MEGSDHAIRLKAEIMVDHFHHQVLAQNKIGGAARAMAVTNGIERAIQYYHAIRGTPRNRCRSSCSGAVDVAGEFHRYHAGPSWQMGDRTRPALSEYDTIPSGSKTRSATSADRPGIRTADRPPA